MPKNSLNRLSHIIQNYDWPNNSIEDIIKSVMAMQETPVSQEVLLEKISEVLGIEVPANRIKDTLQRLIKKGDVVSTQAGLILLGEVVSDIKKKVKNRQELKTSVIKNWIESEFIELQLSEVEKDNIEKDIDIFLKTFFLKHGAESFSYLKEISSGEDLEISSILNEINWSSSLSKQIGKEKFKTFFVHKNADTQRYLLELYVTSVNYISNVCDPDVLKKLKEKLSGKKIYLDSNVVYRLLNLQGDDRAKSVNEALNICRDFGMILSVNNMTLKELKRRIRYDSKVLKDYPTPTNLAAVGIKFLCEENFVSTYWKKAKEIKLSVEDFISFYSHIEEILISQNIVVETEDVSLPEDFLELCRCIDSKLKQTNRPADEDDYVKSDLAYEHDAYNMALMQYLRGNKSTFIDLPAWFATTDQTLVKFQKIDLLFKDLPPVAILPSQLMVLLAFTRPANMSYGEAFLNLFSRSFIPAQSILSNEFIQKILGRIAHFNSTPELAEKVLSDELFIRRISKAETDSERDEIIHDALIEKAGELQTALNDMQVRIKSVEEERSQLENKISQDSLNYKNYEKESMEKVAIAQEQIEQLNLQNSLKAKEVKRWSIFAKHTWATLIFISGLISPAYLYFSGLWPSSSVQQVFYLALPILAIGCSWALLFGKQSVSKMYIVISILADILGILGFATK